MLASLLASSENIDVAVFLAHICDIAHAQEEACFYQSWDLLQFFVDNLGPSQTPEVYVDYEVAIVRDDWSYLTGGFSESGLL